MKKKVRELNIGDCFQKTDRFGETSSYRLTSFRWQPENGRVLLSPSDSVAVPKEKANFASGYGIAGTSVKMDEEVEFTGTAPDDVVKMDMESWELAIERDKELAAFSMKAEEDGLSDEQYIGRWLGFEL